MRKSLLGYAISVCLILVAASVWLAISPTTAYAASCWASCEGNRMPVLCMGDPGTTCSAQDGIGCTSILGGQPNEQLCSDNPEFPLPD